MFLYYHKYVFYIFFFIIIKWRKIEWNLKSLDLEWTVKKQEIKNESKVSVSSKNDDFLKELLLY